MDSCTICMKNKEDGNLALIELTKKEWGNLTYLNKLETLMYTKIIIYSAASICRTCATDLNKAYEFREKVIKALDHWNQLEECANVKNEGNKQAEKLEDCSEIDDNKFISDPISKEEEYTLSREVDSKSDDISVSSDKEEGISEITNYLTLVSKVSEKPKNTSKKKKQKSDSYDCKVCELTFSKKWKLNKHTKVHGVSDEKKYKCTYCDRTFKQSYHLWEHVTTHTGARNYTCNICGKSFQRISSQKRHLRTHQALPGQKSKKSPFLCSICGKSFPYSNGAQRHMRIHTGDKRYQCEFCSRQFNQSTHLRVHLRMHTGERPYSCTMCGAAFSLKVSLHKHMNNHKKKSEDVKIFLNLEPNLSQTEMRDDEDKFDAQGDEFVDDINLYNEEFLVV